MPKVSVVKGFVLTRENTEKVHYPVGVHDMPEEDANHWYTKHHIAGPEEATVLPAVTGPEKPPVLPNPDEDKEPESGDDKKEPEEAKISPKGKK